MLMKIGQTQEKSYKVSFMLASLLCGSLLLSSGCSKSKANSDNKTGQAYQESLKDIMQINIKDLDDQAAKVVLIDLVTQEAQSAQAAMAVKTVQENKTAQALMAVKAARAFKTAKEAYEALLALAIQNAKTANWTIHAKPFEQS